MIEYIELAGIDEVLKNKMIECLGYDTVLNMACNYKVVKNNIEILKSFGITNIEDLLLNKDYIFTLDNNKLINYFKKFNIPNFVNLINNDYNVIDEIFT